MPENLIKRYDIEIIPLTIRINDIEYKDGVNITNEEFYKLIKESNEIPKTYQATYIQYQEIFNKYICEKDHSSNIKHSKYSTGFLPDKPAYSVSYNKNLLSANTPPP